MSDAFARLQELLRQLFQFESRELDFGIYRIMNHKRAEIERFIQHGLAGAVEQALRGGAVARQSARTEELRQTTDRIRESFGEYAINPEGELDVSFRETPLGKQYLDLRSKTGGAVDLEDLKATIFNHVYTFFSRYYDNGDFLSKRRYSRRQKYAIPYNGEEVYLHWANADQYYVKTGEHFTDYRYKSNGVTVHFKVSAADTERNNVKGERRFFVPRVKEAAYDGKTRTLTVPFEYRPLSAKEESAYGARNQQDRIVAEAAEQLPARFQKHPDALAALVSEKRRNAKGEPVSLLEHHLRRYTRRNTSDFFVHKDLKGFLEGELDFYLKNEVLDVDDLESWGPERGESWFEVMRAIKGVGRSIIAFLAQIEDFQKRLFEKKKLVVSAGYCLTLDRVPGELYPEVAASEEQREEWVRLFAIDEIEENLTSPGYTEPLTTDFLKANPHLVLDTRHFSQDFTDRLLASIEDLDAQLDGLLIESENFQALNLLQERYREQVKCIYIDPPYNTGSGDFLYKDSYQHSSWLSMMKHRLQMSKETLTEDGVLFASVDDNEQASLKWLTDSIFEPNNFIATVIWQKVYAPKPSARHFSDDHDYVLVHARNAEVWRPNFLPRTEKQNKAFKNPDNDPRGRWKAGDLSLRNYYSLGTYAITTPSGRVIPRPPKGRYWAISKDKLEALDADNRIWWGEDGSNVPSIKQFLSEVRQGLVPQTIWPYDEAGHNQDAKKELVRLMNIEDTSDVFTTPKPVKLIRRILQISTDKDSIAMDFFAGSGTTGHAVIDLNREDGGNRKYILVEMGEYFDTVMKPRILKVIYSKDWRDGKPVSREGVSHALKYMKLESYEDALDNIAFTHEREGQEALELYGDEYLLRYMLDFETRDSDTLLNVEKLTAPFRYRLRLRGAPGGETRDVPVDLPETFAYLLGMRVRSRKVYHDGERRYLVYRGATPERGEVAVIWRDTEGWSKADFERDERFVREEGLAEGADEVFVNGDSFIPEARPLEAVFKQRMLAEPVAGR